MPTGSHPNRGHDKQVLEIIVRLTEANGYPPTMREIAQAYRPGRPHESVVYNRLSRLRDEGYVTWEPIKARTLKVIKPIGELQKEA